MRLPLLVAALVAFTGYTGWVMFRHGVIGFLQLAARDAWGLQLLLDLFVMLGVFATWQYRDAKKHGLPALLYVGVTFTMGSMGALLYLVHREVARRRRPEAFAASADFD